MPSERMTLGQRRMVEILDRVAAHAKPFHDRARTVVGHSSERYDLRERERSKAVVKRQSRSLRRITASPVLECQTPAYFYAGCERGGESWNRQSGESDAACYIRDLDCPQAEIVLAEMFLDALDHCVAFGATEATWEELHNARIGIHCGKRVAILLAPLTEADACAGQRRKSAQCRVIRAGRLGGERSSFVGSNWPSDCRERQYGSGAWRPAALKRL